MHRIRARVEKESGCPLYEPGDGLDIVSPTVFAIGSAPVCMRAVLALGATLRKMQTGGHPGAFDRIHCGGCHAGEAWFAIRLDGLAFYPPVAEEMVRSAASALARTRLFAGIRPRMLERIARFLRIGGCSSGDMIVTRGRPIRTMGIILRGRLEIPGAPAGVPASLGPGDSFGEALLLSGEPAPYDIRCRERAIFLEVRREDLPFLASQAPGLGVSLAGNLIRNAEPAPLSPGFSGALELIHPAEVIQALGHSRLTGCLHARRPGESFLLYTEEGRPVHAVWGRMEGRPAFFQFLGWKSGSFRFEVQAPIPARTIADDPVMLLLEGLRMLDEAEGGAGSA